MQLGPLALTFHRTVRVADSRTLSNLPPSLGHATVRKVSEFRANCPETWEDDGYFIGLHDTEALWISFSTSAPVAIMVGAGGINAVSGEKLGTVLAAGGYMVSPPQPWLDGWKSEGGSVYQFVSTPFEKGEGLSVGEQILGAESVSGGIGIAVFESKEPLKAGTSPSEGFGGSAWGEIGYYGSKGLGGQSTMMSAGPTMRGSVTRGMSAAPVVASEMGIGKGGLITQKIYGDPHGIEVWRDAPSATAVVYLVSAEDYATITGETVPSATGHEGFNGAWYGLKDEALPDVAGPQVFAGLKSAFPGDTSNVKTTAKAIDNEDDGA